MSSRERNGLLALVISFATLAALAVFGLGRIAYQALEPVHPAGDQEAAEIQLFLIERGQGLGQVARALETAGLIRNARALSLMARVIGDEGNLRAGEYEVSAGWSARTILNRITSGRVKTYEIVLPEGIRATEVALRLEAAGLRTPKISWRRWQTRRSQEHSASIKPASKAISTPRPIDCRDTSPRARSYGCSSISSTPFGGKSQPARQNNHSLDTRS